MRHRIRAGCMLAGCWLLAGCGISKELHRTYPLAEDGRVIVDGGVGDVTVRSWEYDEIRIDVVTRAKTGERLREVGPRFDSEPGEIRMWVESLAAADGGSPTAPSGRARVEWDLTVPVGATLERVLVSNGNLVIEDVLGNIHATADGGSIRARFARLQPGRSISLEARGGNVEVVLPELADARLDARARGGEVRSTIGIPMRSALPQGGTEGSLEEIRGSGATRIRLTAIRGDVRILTSR